MNVIERNQLYLKGVFPGGGLFPHLEVAPAGGFFNWDFGLAEVTLQRRQRSQEQCDRVHKTHHTSRARMPERARPDPHKGNPGARAAIDLVFLYMM